jgi:hypothetical protein
MPTDQVKPVGNKKKRTLIMFLSMVFVLLSAVFIFRYIAGGDEDFWYCGEGEWKKHGNPLSQQPKYSCITGIGRDAAVGSVQDQVSLQSGANAGIEENKAESSNKIIVINPKNGDMVSGTLLLSGKAPGNWFFEGSFPVKIIDEKNQEIVKGIAESYGEWMKEGMVPFHAELKIPVSSGSGWLVLQKDNPSGQKELDEEMKMPIEFGNEKNILTKVFFGSSFQDPNHLKCEKVYSVPRSIGTSLATSRSSVEELLKGPTELEKEGGFFSGINPGVMIRSFDISDGIAKVDFDGKLEENVSGACLVSMIRSQITETLKQFPAVKEVIISINGRTQDILQP